MLTIYIDNKPYQVKNGVNLLHACLSLGFNLPYFCWHPAMNSVGACRQCAVKMFKDEKDTKGRIVMACMTPAKDGTRISIDDPEAKEFRKSIIEWMMVPHPHDCPVCDEGGECHLQDMTVMTGHVYRKYRGKKRTYRNQDLGPFITHEMNRCIQCYRCVRFYRDYAGGRDFDVFSWNHKIYFGRYEAGALESEFSGNLVEICPTGVFTDKTLSRHYTRKWDFQTAPSICVHCAVGCNTIPGERYKTLRRIRNRYNRNVNGYFLCDRGRFGYEFVNSALRIRMPLISQSLDHSVSHVPPPLVSSIDGGRIWVKAGADKHMKPSAQGQISAPSGFEPTHPETARKQISNILARSTGVIGIGSPRASLESNFVLRELVGLENFYAGISEHEHQLVSAVIDILGRGPATSASLLDAESSDAVLILGEDVTNTAPMLALALRQSIRKKPSHQTGKLGIPSWNDAAVREAVQNQKGPFFVAAPYSTRLDDVATKMLRAAPDDLARLGFAVAHEINPDAPEVKGISGDMLGLAREISDALRTAARPLVVSGVSCGSRSLIEAAASVAWSLEKQNKKCGLSLIVPECNSMGLALMAAQNLQKAFNAVQDGRADTVIIVENDLFRRAEQNMVDAFLAKAKQVIVLDHIHTSTASRADVILPAGTFAEADGTFVNYEGRAQRFFQIYVPETEIHESWRWLLDVAQFPESGRSSRSSILNSLATLDSVQTALAEQLPIFKPILGASPPASFRTAGQKIARQSHRYSGRTAISADKTVHEPRPPQDPDTPLAFTMEGYQGQPPSPLLVREWAPGWNSVQSLNKFQEEVGGQLRNEGPEIKLIEPSSVEGSSFFRNIPEPFEPHTEKLLIIPRPHIFGSEELSVLAPGIAERSPKPYVAVNGDDAKVLRVEDSEEVEITGPSIAVRLQLRVDNSIPKGIVAIHTAAWIKTLAPGSIKRIIQ